MTLMPRMVLNESPGGDLVQLGVTVPFKGPAHLVFLRTFWLSGMRMS